MSPSIGKLLDEATVGQAGDQPIFTGPQGRRVNAAHFGTLWAKVEEFVGLVNCSPKTARHQFVSQMLMNGFTFGQIMQFTGHATVTQLEKTYGHLHKGSQRQIMAQMDELAAKRRAKRGVESVGLAVGQAEVLSIRKAR